MTRFILFIFFHLISAPYSFAQFPPVLDLADFAEDVRIISHGDINFGHGLAIGDFNDDGYNDILAGNYAASDEAAELYNIGNAHIIFGPSKWPPVIDLWGTSIPYTVIHGGLAGENFGWSVTSTDINADGVTDAIVGTSANFRRDGRGATYIFYGKKEWSRNIFLGSNTEPTPGATKILGKAPQNFLGTTLSSGDVNGDGMQDLFTGGFGAGELGEIANVGEEYVLYGSANIWPEIVPLNATSIKITAITGGRRGQIGVINDCFDLDGDGFADLLLSSPSFEPDSNSAESVNDGRVFILYGSDSLPESIQLSDESDNLLGGTVIIGANKEKIARHFAHGDVNGDGLTDVIIGTFTDNVFILYGVPDWPEVIELKTYTGLTKITNYGARSGDVAAADINGDGYTDVMVAASSLKQEKVFIIYGAPELPAHFDLSLEDNLVKTTQILGYQKYQFLGLSMATGNLNGDGTDDLIISAIETMKPDDTGELYIFFGRKTKRMLPAGQEPQLLYNYPNPFNLNTVITYRLAQPQNVKITIVNARGQTVAKLVDGWIEEGEHTAFWNGQDSEFTPAGAGVYFCHLRGDTFSETRKILLLK